MLVLNDAIISIYIFLYYLSYVCSLLLTLVFLYFSKYTVTAKRICTYSYFPVEQFFYQILHLIFIVNDNKCNILRLN